MNKKIKLKVNRFQTPALRKAGPLQRRNYLNGFVIVATFLLFSCGEPNNHSNNRTKTSGTQEKIILSHGATFRFEKYPTGKMPAGWSVALTGKGKMCQWEITEDEGTDKVLAQISKDNHDYRFNLIVNDSLRYKDLEMSVKFKGIAGNTDQGGGPVWRYQDENNYYVARANPLENNFRVYKVVDGDRSELKSARLTINSGQWYSLKIIMKGDVIQCFFNNKLELETKDNTFDKAGKIGLWTKSDAQTYFDDLKIKAL